MQIRGSIPLFWQQVPNSFTPKPDIVYLQDQQDPEYKATKSHFAQLLHKFSYPIYCFNLTKQFNHREMIVANPYNRVVNNVINTELPKQVKIHFIHYDVKAKKKEEPRFPSGLIQLAEGAMQKIGFFHIRSGNRKERQVRLQRGIMRTNCIDSLDRTNFAQEIFGYLASLK